jgi:hypothetical protein
VIGWYIVRKGNLTQSFPTVIAYNLLTTELYTQNIPINVEIIPMAFTDEPYVLLRANGMEGSDKLLNLKTGDWVYVPASLPNRASVIEGRYYTYNNNFCYQSDLVNLPTGNIFVKASKNETYHKIIYHDDLITAYLDFSSITVKLIIEDRTDNKKWSYQIGNSENFNSVQIIRMANEWYYLMLPSMHKYFALKLKDRPPPIIIHPGD